jgi:hypothetical protein
MADYNINAITRRVVFTGSAGLGPYDFSFEILDQDDLAVYFNATSLTITTDYTVTINANGTGSVNIVTGGSVPSTPTGSDQIIIVGARDIERVTDFVTAGDLLASSLNEQLDALTIFDQQLAEEGQRSMRAPVYDPALVADGGIVDMTLPAKADRAGRFLAFDTNGNPTATTNVGDFKGDWAASTTYRIGDLVKDTTDDSIYRVNADHTSSGTLPLTTNTNAAFYDLFVDLSDINASEAAAAASAAAAAADAVLTAADVVSTNADVVLTNADVVSTNADAASTAADVVTTNNNVTAAQAAQAAAEAALDTFDDRFLGAKASDPTVDNDGNALLDGAIYFNTTDDIMKVYDLTNTVWRDLALTGSDQTNVNLVAGQISPTNNIATVAGIDNEITTVAGINTTHLSNVSGVATEIGLLGTADAVADMNTLGTAAIVTDMDLLADRATDIGLLADIEDGTTATNAIQTVAANLSGITAFADVYSSGPTDPTTNLNEGDLFFNTTSDTLKVYTGSAWEQGVTAGSGFLPLSGGQLTGNLTFSATQTVDGRDVSADGTKLDGIEAGATADQTASEILTAVKTVDGAASGLDADLLDGQQGTYYLDANNFTNMPASDVVSDTTPQLGGTLDVNSNDIDFGQSNKALFGGVGGDLEIYHNGTNAYIDNNDGILYIRNNVDGDDGSDIYIQAKSGENGIIVQDDGEVQLYYNGVEKLNTSNTGITVAGTVAATAVTGDGSGLTNLPAASLTASSTIPSEGGAATTNIVQGLAKVWINFKGTGTITIRDDFGASTIVDNTTGDYTVNFTNSMSNTNYLSLNIGSGDSSNFGPSGETKTRATGSVRFETRYQGNNVVYDHEDCYVLIQGDLA